MKDKTALYFGALLHDVGKIVYRGMSGKGTHSKLGADFITDEVSVRNESFAGEVGRSVIEQIRYHHAKELSGANLAADSLAYITYFADNISAGMDRKDEGDQDTKTLFDPSINLSKVFNVLNGHQDHNVIAHEDYNVIRERLKNQLIQMEISHAEVNSLLNLLEATCTTVPSSTNTSQLVDISLYDHAKTTAGIAACILDFLESSKINDFRQALFSKDRSPQQYEVPMFLLYSCDMSGIQDFIYTISGSGALKQLRARSLYLEMLLEHIVDELLEALDLCRANLLYTGGGHAYLLLPNTIEAKQKIEEFQAELKDWFLENYRTNLYLASAWVECSANDLANAGEDKQRYANLFKELSMKLSFAKAHRYTARDIKRLNFEKCSSYDRARECRECHRADALRKDEDICELCHSLGAVSADLAKKDVFAIIEAGQEVVSVGDGRLSLPFGYELVALSRSGYLDNAPTVRRVYTKNSWDVGIDLSTHIWMGDYTADTQGKGISDYAAEGVTLSSVGINRLGVLRADVDNLGAAFASGIPMNVASISRTATLSCSLSTFFKNEINEILKNGSYRLQIIYSGGDDLFIVGNWSDVIYAAIDINCAFKEFTGNDCLSLSAGIGMFEDKYPIARMASVTGELEDAAKLHQRVMENGDILTKNAVALWDENNVFGWDEFIEIVEPRKCELASIFSNNDKGKSFIYKMILLLRAYDEVISAPRLAYLLARSFEGIQETDELCKKFYNWAADDNQRRYLIAALEWYVYSIRERG